MAAFRSRSLADLSWHLVTTGCTALVLALTVFAACPKLHDWLHAAGTPTGEEGCPVTLFAGGVSLPLGTVAALPPSTAWQAPTATAPAEIFLTSPRYLRQPERGPPGAEFKRTPSAALADTIFPAKQVPSAPWSSPVAMRSKGFPW